MTLEELEKKVESLEQNQKDLSKAILKVIDNQEALDERIVVLTKQDSRLTEKNRDIYKILGAITDSIIQVQRMVLKMQYTNAMNNYLDAEGFND